MAREPLPDPKRKRLEKTFEVATKKAATASAASDFDYVADLLGQCVAADPGNAVYVRNYIENLQKKFGGDAKKVGALAQLKVRGVRGPVKKALAQEQWDEVVKQGLKVLAINPWDLPTLIAMATAADKSGDADCEVSYVMAALKGAPKDYDCNRLMAQVMTKRGLINDAITWWHRVEEIRPHDDEAKRSIAALTVQKARSSGKFDDDGEVARKAKVKAQQQEELSAEHKLRRKIRDEPDKLAHYMELAQLYVNEERFREAEGLLAKAFEISDANSDVRDKWEDCQIRLLRQKIAQTKDPEQKKKLERLHMEKDTEFCRNRVERYPNNLIFKFDLGYRYMRLKRYDEAIRELQVAKNDPRKKGACMLVLGECFQQIKQYDLAMKHYEAAIQEMPDREAESKKKAMYLAGRLALALFVKNPDKTAVHNLDVAHKHLTTLAALDFTYKDVSALLDKITRLRENPESGKAREYSQEPQKP
jgi:tetratricopeptide (TPR) repeat protein